MENLEIWNKLKSVPQNRLKTIQAGRLKGMSDINPQWRYEKLTEIFGICGIGWKFTIEKQWIEKTDTGAVASFVNINLFIKVNGEWSDAIPANGGSMFIAMESKGPYVSDECFKMAITDAIGTAAKMIGVASDIYQGLPGTKYDKQPDPITDTRPFLNKGEKLDKAIEYLLKGGSISKIEEGYKLSKEIREVLNQTVDKLKETV
jgi:hypothetical protein